MLFDMEQQALGLGLDEEVKEGEAADAEDLVRLTHQDYRVDQERSDMLD